jgi:hypothetical protein
VISFSSPQLSSRMERCIVAHVNLLMSVCSKVRLSLKRKGKLVCMNKREQNLLILFPNFISSQSDTTNPSSLSLPSLIPSQLATEISGDCRMGWISRPHRLCGSSFVRKRFNEVVLDDVWHSLLLLSPYADCHQGKWYFNDERTSPRRELFSGGFFHFRFLAPIP